MAHNIFIAHQTPVVYVDLRGTYSNRQYVFYDFVSQLQHYKLI